jgi:hypothetical protein
MRRLLAGLEAFMLLQPTQVQAVRARTILIITEGGVGSMLCGVVRNARLGPWLAFKARQFGSVLQADKLSQTKARAARIGFQRDDIYPKVSPPDTLVSLSLSLSLNQSTISSLDNKSK